MFGTKKRVVELEKEVRALTEQMRRALDHYETLLEALVVEKRELFDRLMARDWDQWVGSPSAQTLGRGEETREEIVWHPTMDEANIGEILDDEELG